MKVLSHLVVLLIHLVHVFVELDRDVIFRAAYALLHPHRQVLQSQESLVVGMLPFPSVDVLSYHRVAEHFHNFSEDDWYIIPRLSVDHV